MSLAYKISAYNRKRKWKIFNEIIKPSEKDRVLDVGFTDTEHSETDNYMEKNYKWPEKITALGINEPKQFSKNYPKVKVVTYDGREFPFEDNEFDIVWSNAVIEHVGDFNRQVEFMKEIKRVGNKVFITTPNRYFPIEIHSRIPLLHYLPKKWFDKILHWLKKDYYAGDYMHLLSYRDLKTLLDEAEVYEYKIVKNRFMGLVLDFIIIF